MRGFLHVFQRDLRALALAATLTPIVCMARGGGAVMLPACRVSIEAEPANAEMALDWRPLAECPNAQATESGKWEVRLEPGDYVVHFSAPGYNPETAELHVRQGDANALVARTLTKTTGLALLKSDPPGAEITIDGVSFGSTPRLVADLPLGTWQATFSLPGFKDQTLQIALKDRTPVVAEARLASDTATLVISSNVEGAQIKVNGAIRGTAPCTVERLPAGEILIEATAPGYRDFAQRGRVGEAEELSVEVRLEPLPSSLDIHSLPAGARVYLDNNYSGVTPLSIKTLQPGTHRIRVEKDGFDPMARTVTLGRGDKAAEEFRLKSNTGMLSVTSIPAGVAVYIDGVKRGETPVGEVRNLSGVLEISGVAEGAHKLEFVKPGYFKKDGECQVRRGETVIQRVELKRRFIPDYEVVTETGSHKGSLVEISATAIRIETRPGVVSTYSLANVTRHGPLTN